VTLLAVLAELPVVLVTVAITTAKSAGAVDPPGVAENAVILDLGFAVEPNQRESGIFVVVERVFAFSAFDVAIRTRLVVVLALVHVLVRVAAETGAITVARLGVGLVATHARALGVLTEQPKPKPSVVDVGAFEGPARSMTANAIGRCLDHWVFRDVAAGASLRWGQPRPNLFAPKVTSATIGLRMPTSEREAKLFVFDLRAVKIGILGVAFLAIARARDDGVAWYVAFSAGSRGPTTRHHATLVTIDTGLIEVLADKVQLRILTVL